MCTSGRVRAALAGIVALGATAIAAAQDSKTLGELKRWHDKLAESKTAISVVDGQQARAELKKWDLSPDKLQLEPRGQLLRLEIFAALAVGDANGALALLPALERDFPKTQETLRAKWMTAVAAGDAQLAQQTLEQLKEGGTKEKAIAARLERLRPVGTPAPDREMVAEGGQKFPLRKRGGAILVLDFWNMREAPTERQVAALRGLAEGYAAEPKVEFLGISDDKAEQVEAAKKLAAEKGYKWAQLYEATASGAALTEPAFHVVAMPWDVVIDGDGNVRAVGTASEPEFQYALRAAVAEVKGDYPPVAPKTTEGVAAARAAGETPAVEAEKKGEKKEKEEQAKPEPEPPHNEEAAKLLDQARLYLKTGKKTEAKKLLRELIEKYPNTWEAREAKRLGLV